MNGQAGIKFDTYQDILFVNWFVQVATIASNWFWLVYLSVPAYLVYNYGSFCCPSFCGGGRSKEPEPLELSAQELKRQQKKQKKQERAQKRSVGRGQ